ncbi:MAG: thiopurine S-methyltransferase [Myxococcaceae bacterium]|nr:thiopurine S-methyltransferase [Myxococcaceae bacterium]
MKANELSDAAAWNARYAQGQTGWDRGGAAPALVALLTRIPHGQSALTSGRARVLVPGAGFGHDAIAWAGAGFDVTAVDFAKLAVIGLRQWAEAAGVTLRALEADIFELPHELEGAFDVVWEQTCLCAIDPARRHEYVQMLERVLVPGGTVYALLWNHQRAGGPPFDLPLASTRALFEPAFEVREATRLRDSGRAGEYLLTLQRR